MPHHLSSDIIRRQDARQQKANKFPNKYYPSRQSGGKGIHSLFPVFSCPAKIAPSLESR